MAIPIIILSKERTQMAIYEKPVAELIRFEGEESIMTTLNPSSEELEDWED